MDVFFDHPEALSFSKQLDPDKAKNLVFQKSIFEGIPNALLVEQARLQSAAKAKLPTLASSPYWVFPDQTALEQSTSEILARWKARMFFAQPAPFWDACAGLGSDLFFMAHADQSVQVWEPDLNRAHALQIHLQKAGFSKLQVHSVPFPSPAELKNSKPDPGFYLYADPDRRPIPGQRSLSWQDAQPGLHPLIEWAESAQARFLVKLSPMDDGEALLEHFPQFEKLAVVSLHNEVKELLLYRNFSKPHPGSIGRSAVEIRHDHSWAQIPIDASFLKPLPEVEPMEGSILLDPWAVLRKNNYARSIAWQLQLDCLSNQARLFQTDKLLFDWPGRVFRIQKVFDSVTQAAKQIPGNELHVVSRSFAASAADLVRKYKWTEKGARFLFCFENAKGKKQVLLCERIENEWSEAFWNR